MVEKKKKKRNFEIFYLYEEIAVWIGNPSMWLIQESIDVDRIGVVNCVSFG